MPHISSPFGTVFIDKDNHTIFENLLGDGEKRAHRHEAVSMTPAVDIYEDDKGYTAWMDLPGVDKGSIQLSVSGHTLSVNAHTAKLNQKNGHWIRHERRVGTYVRSLHLGEAVDADNISANYADGTLKLTLTKKKQGKSKKIDIDME